MEDKKDQIAEQMKSAQNSGVMVPKTGIMMAMACVMIIAVGMFGVTAATVFVDGNTAQLELLIKTFGQTLLLLVAFLAPSPMTKQK